MFQRSLKVTALVAATAAAGFSGATIAGAADSSSPSSASTSANRGPGAAETALTGATKEKVEAAALAKVKGTVVRTETDDGGAYESHIRRSDGTEVVVEVGNDFQVTSVEDAPAGGHGGPGGRGGGMHADLAAIAKTLAVTEAKLRSAVDAARPDRPASGTRPDRGAELTTAIAKSLGEKTADVQAVLDATRQAGGRGRGDESALVSALAAKFSVSQQKAQAAVDAAEKAHAAEHSARETELYAAVAKALGKDADAVQRAFEANRPARPTP